MNDRRPTLFVCAPTYREPTKVSLFLESLRHVEQRPLEILIVNANPGDETTRRITAEPPRDDVAVHEIPGKPAEFWTATMNRAIDLVLERAAETDWVAVMNVDIEFHGDVIGELLASARRLGRCHVGALGLAGDRAVSSGVAVRSWALGLNRHPLAGFAIGDIGGDPIPVDFLPSRCMLMPAAALRAAGRFSSKLPHYGADYEYSRRLVTLGYPAFLVPRARVECDVANTGTSVFTKRTTFRQRLRELWTVKNPSNPRYRSTFIRLTYPAYAVPSAVLSYAGRTALEVLLGGDRLRRLLPGQERGFSS